MTLGELRASIRKLPLDMDNMEVYSSYCITGETKYDPVCFTGYMPLPGKEFIIIGTYSEMKHMIENGEVEPPKNYRDLDKEE